MPCEPQGHGLRKKIAWSLEEMFWNFLHEGKVSSLPGPSTWMGRGGAGDYRVVAASFFTDVACGPLAPGMTSNSTRSPSFKERKPPPSIAE